MIIESSYQLNYHRAIERVGCSGISREIIPYNCSVNVYRRFQYTYVRQLTVIRFYTIIQYYRYINK